jgi:hypothetical protein
LKAHLLSYQPIQTMGEIDETLGALVVAYVLAWGLVIPVEH